MNELRIRPTRLAGAIRAPPSKSHTHRELIASFLADGPSRLRNPLVSLDTVATRDGIARLGAEVRITNGQWMIRPPKPERARRRVRIDCGESGTSLRFLTALAATREFPVTLTGSGRLPHRPMGPLIDLLRAAGARIRRERARTALPMTILGPIHGGTYSIPSSGSSQFASAALLVFPSLPGHTRLVLDGDLVSAPYIGLTREVLERRGVRWTVRGRAYGIHGPQRLRGGTARIPGDASSAAYAWAGAALTGGPVRVRGVAPDSGQADLVVLDWLRSMGAKVRLHADGASVRGPAPLRGMRVDVRRTPDLLPLLGVLGAFATSPSRLDGTAHARFKESDRVAATGRLVRGFGGRVERRGTTLVVRPGCPPRSFSARLPADHRVVMAAAIGALRVGGRVPHPESVKKSYTEFWDTIRHLSAPAGDPPR